MKSDRPVPETLRRQGLTGVEDNLAEGEQVICHHVLFQFLEPELRDYCLGERPCAAKQSSG